MTWREPALRIEAICWLCHDADRRSAGLARSTRRRLMSQRILVSLCSTPSATKLGNVLLDVQCHETRRRVLQAIGQLGPEGEVFTPMVVHSINDLEPSIRRQSISTLNQLGTVATATAIDMLVKCLRDKDALVRETAVQTLAPLVNAECASAFADCLNDTSEKVKKLVCKLLPNLLSENMEIAAVLLSHNSAVARRDAVVSLGNRGVAASPWASQLASCLGDSDGRVRRASAKALAMCGCVKPYASQLISLLRDPDACEESFRALEATNFEDENKQDNLDQLVISELEITLASTRVAARNYAISLLLRLDCRGMQVGVALMRSASVVARASAVSLLGQFGPRARQWLQDIASLLDDEDASVRLESTMALTTICEREVPKFIYAGLGSLINDASSEVSASAMLSLHRLQGIAEHASVVALRLHSGEARVRMAAATALSGPWGSPFVLQILSLLDDGDPLVRKASVASLRGIDVISGSNAESMAEVLAKSVFQDPFVEVRCSACDVIAKKCGMSGLIAIAKHCGLEDIRGRWVTIVSGSRWVLDSGERCRKLSMLGSLGGVAIPFAGIVADQLCDHYWEVRVAAAGSLASLGAKDFASRLQALVRPGVPPFVRSAVADALNSLGATVDVLTNAEDERDDQNADSDHTSDSGPDLLWDV